jgi:hypothetical protein
MNKTRRCGICAGPQERADFVNAEVAKGASLNSIEVRSREMGMVAKAETVKHHMKLCIEEKGVSTQNVPLAAQALATRSKQDFATLVQQEAINRLKTGELRVSTADGLHAQGLLDKREEKRKDRQILVALGRLLAGGGNAPPPEVVEGEYVEVDLYLPAGEPN